MPVYEYQCGGCGQRFDAFQSVHAITEETACSHCGAKKATRLMSAFASKVVGTHKPTFSEMKAYNMLDQRMDKFKKLPPIFGKRTPVTPNTTNASGSGSQGEGGSGGA
jgi:putative FmdB family regulatory protein